MQNIQNKIDEINEAFAQIDGHPDLHTLIIKKTLKIGEEYGELCDAVLSEIGSQRKEKLATYNKDDLESELADVIVSALTLARYLKLDLEELIVNKLTKIEKRLKSSY